MAKKIKILDNVSGVEQIINVSSLASNTTISNSDLMLLEQSNDLKKVSVLDLTTKVIDNNNKSFKQVFMLGGM